MEKSIVKIPKFKLADQNGEEHQFKDLTGAKGLVLYVYPKDNTSGCTAEAVEFQERLSGFEELGFKVTGLSKDSVKSHEKFAAKNELEFPLLSDPETGLIQALGAWGDKKMAGRTYQGTIRQTFVFDAKGKLIKEYPKVKAKGHAEAVQKDLLELTSK